MNNPNSFRVGLLLKFGALFFVLLLAFLSVSSFKVISRTRDYLIKDSEKRLLNLAEVVSHDIQGRYGDFVRDQFYLYSIFVRESLADLVLLDPQGRIVMGSLPPQKKGKEYRDFGIPAGRFSEVWKGKVEVSPIYERDGRAVRSVCFPVTDDEGRTSAAGVVTLDVNHIEDLTQQGTTYFFLKALISVFLVLVFFYLLKTLMQSEKRLLHEVKGAAGGPAGFESGDNVAFVVDTFHTLVGDLKDKERGLKELKDKAEEKARSVESYNENILRSIQSGVMTFDGDCRVKTLNNAAETILKMEAGACSGKGVDEIFGTEGWVSALVNKTLKEGKPERRAEGEAAIKGGGSRWIGASTSPMVGAGGAAQGVILVFTDITEVKDLRERMELKERLTLMGEMSAGIAHELRNPMGVISGYADLLARRLGDDDASREAARSINAEIKVMDEIISEFMNFSQPTELNVARLDIKGVVGEALKSVAGTDKGVFKDLRLDEGLPPVEGDAVLLRQAFANIIKNSVEAMPGGGALSIAARVVEVGKDGALAGLSLAGGKYVNLEISDTGVGIPESDIRKIFTPFFTTKEKGTGLGLALVQKILVYHGGRVTVKSAKGKGTTFNVYLPAAGPEKAGP